MLSKAQAVRTQVNKVASLACSHASKKYSTDSPGGAPLGVPTEMMASEAFVESMVAQVSFSPALPVSFASRKI